MEGGHGRRSEDGDDGLLEAWEIMRMSLHADIAILSAHESNGLVTFLTESGYRIPAGAGRDRLSGGSGNGHSSCVP